MCKFYDILQIKLLTPPTPHSCDKKNYDKLLVLFRPTAPEEIMTKKDFFQRVFNDKILRQHHFIKEEWAEMKLIEMDKGKKCPNYQQYYTIYAVYNM